MFLVPHDRDFTASSLGQGRTLSRALDDKRTRETVEVAWPGGEFKGRAEEWAASLFELDSLRCSDLWGPQLLYDIGSGQVTIARNEHADHAIDLAKAFVTIQHDVLNTMGHESAGLSKIMSSFASNSLLLTAMHFSIHLKKAIEYSLIPRTNRRKLATGPLFDKIKEKKLTYRVPYSSLTFYFTETIVLVEYKSIVYACSHDHLLCYSGKVDTLVSNEIMQGWAKKTYLTTRDIVALEELSTLLHDFHRKYDQGYFAGAKMLDGLCQAYFLMHPEVDGRENDLMLNEIRRSCEGDTMLEAFFHDASHYLRMMSSSALIEASCYGKLSGHPTVDVPAGMEQLNERVNRVREVSHTVITNSVNALKEQYVVNYLIRRKTWPPLLEPVPQTARFLAREDAHPTGVYAARHNLAMTREDWMGLNFAPSRRVLGITSIISYVKDKTICLGRDDLFSTFAAPLLQVLHEENDPLSTQEVYEQTSLVLYTLLTRDLLESFNEFAASVIRARGEDMADVMAYLVIKLVPKEGELKTKARLFGEKPFVSRLFSMMQEMAAVGFLRDYFPKDQAMTCGELDLKRRLHMLTNLPTPSPDHEWIQFVVDVSGWNSGMRSDTVAPIGRVLDQVFDTSMFAKTHVLYENTVVFHKDGPNITGWPRQLGGIEGHNQDTWVITYLSQMHAWFKRLGYQYHFMDMGDNFIARVAVPRAHLEAAGGAAQFAMNLSRQLSQDLTLLGHDAKPDETTCSRFAFIFCHQYRVRGLQVPCHFRKVGKMSGSTDAFFPLLDDNIGCSFSTAHATAEQGVLYYAPYHCAAIWSFFYLLNSETAIGDSQGRNRDLYRHMSDTELIGLMLIPNVLGGFPVIYLESMAMRSEADHLPQFIRLVIEVREARPQLFRILCKFLYQRPERGASLLTLMADPRALALTRPPGPVALLRKEMDGRLGQIAVNEELVALFEAYDEAALDHLIRSISHNTSWPARLVSGIYSSSGFAIRQSFVACFESSRTAVAFLMRTRPYQTTTPKLCRRMLRANQEVQAWRAEVLQGNRVGVRGRVPICPYIEAQWIRAFHWMRDIQTITSPPMGHCFLIGPAIRRDEQETYMQLRVGYIRDRLTEVSDHVVAGNHEPFLGHTTSSATKGETSLERSKDALIDATLGLALLESWATTVDMTGSFPRLVEAMIRAFTDIPVEDLQMISGKRSHGTIQHHLPSTGFNPTIAPNTQTTILSLFTQNERTLKKFQDGVKYPINFLEEILFAKYKILQCLQWGRRLAGVDKNYHMTLSNCQCLQPIRVDPFTVVWNRGLDRLAQSALTMATRRRVTNFIQAGLDDHNVRGATAGPMPGPQESAVSQLIAYWAIMVDTIHSLSLTVRDDTNKWRDLLYLQGMTAPKKVSLNALRHIRPAGLFYVISRFNHTGLFACARRMAEVQPGVSSVHSPYAAMLIELCEDMTNGMMHPGILNQVELMHEPLHEMTNFLYDTVWHTPLNMAKTATFQQLWLGTDTNIHVFPHILYFLATPYAHLGVGDGTPSVRTYSPRWRQFCEDGSMELSVQDVFRLLGRNSESEAHCMTIYRIDPARLADRGRLGKMWYRITPPLRIDYTPINLAGLEGFDHALDLRMSFGEYQDLAYAPELPRGDADTLEIWNSSTRSPSRVIFLLEVLKLDIPIGAVIAVVGDGMGGITDMFSLSNRAFHIHYSTKFVSTGGERGEGSFPGRPGTVHDVYQKIGLRDVTHNYWRDAFAEDETIVPCLLLSDAELVSVDDHLVAIDCLGSTLIDHTGMLLAIRVKGLTSGDIALCLARGDQYCDSMTYITVPGQGPDGFIVLRYGRERTPLREPTFATMEAIENQCIHQQTAPVTMAQMIALTVRWTMGPLPLLRPIGLLQLTLEMLTTRAVGAAAAAAEINAVIEGPAPHNLGGLRGLLPALLALRPFEGTVNRLRHYYGDDIDGLVDRGESVRRVMHAIRVAGLAFFIDDGEASDPSSEEEDSD